MTNKERLAYAEKRLDEAIRNDNNHDILHWIGYREAMQRVVENEQQITIVKPCPHCNGGRSAIGADGNGRPIYIDMRETPSIEGDEWGIKIRFCPMCGLKLETEET